MYKYFLFIAVALQATSSIAQNTAQLISESENQIIVSFQFDIPQFRTVQTSQGTASLLSNPGLHPLLNKGYPELLSMSRSVQVPAGAIVQAEIVSSEIEYVNDILIAPSKGNLKRDVNPSTKPYVFDEVYQNNQFWPLNQVSVSETYQFRGTYGNALHVTPYQYNPVTKQLKIARKVVVALNLTFPNGLSIVKPNVNKDFKEVYKLHYLNFANEKYNTVAERPSLLVVSHSSFLEAIEPYVLWKRQIGYRVEVVDYAQIGSSQDLKTFVTNHYNQHQTGYLLLVGDHQQVPSFLTQYQFSDNYYGMTEGNDFYPDMFVGRFSAENEDHIRTMVNRVLVYEKQNQLQDNWFSKAIGIASEEGPGDDNEYDWEHVRGINEQLLGYTYTEAFEFFEGSQGGADAEGFPGPQEVVTALNQGASLLNYTGHGYEQGFATSSLSSTEVSQLENVGKYPAVIAVACVNGNFTDQTCFAEEWLRAKNQSGTPTGAIATLMATINQSWNPPMCAQDEMNRILTDNLNDFYPKTFGCISHNGMMKMNDEYAEGGFEMTATWVLFGDPTITLRTAAPVQVDVVHPPVVETGISTLTFDCNTEGAVVSLTQNGEVIATGTVVNGSVTLNFDPIVSPDSIEVVGFAFNGNTYSGTILVDVATGPFVSNNQWQAINSQGLSQNYAAYSQQTRLHFDLKNVGNALAQNVTGVLTTSSPYVTITDGSANFGDIAEDGNSGLIDAFGFTVANLIPDGVIAPFTLTATDASGGSWNISIQLELRSPVLFASYLSLSEIGGNGNEMLDSEENASISIRLANNSITESQNVTALLNSNTSCVEVTEATATSSGINGQDFTDYTFTISTNEACSINSYANFTFGGVAGLYGDTISFYVPLNQVLETFESNDFTNYTWSMNGTLPWVTSEVQPYEGDFCSKSGAITDSQNSELKITIDVAQPDSIVFYARTSCEADYDFLKFYIGGALRGSWTGNTPWTRYAFSVPPGLRTFTWRYEKDAYYLDFEDAVYLDNVRLPVAEVADTSGTGLGEVSADYSLEVYPNPALNYLQVNGLTINSNQKFSYSVFTIDGKLEQQGDLNSNGKINVQGLIRGFYVLKLTPSNGAPSRTRFVKL